MMPKPGLAFPGLNSVGMAVPHRVIETGAVTVAALGSVGEREGDSSVAVVVVVAGVEVDVPAQERFGVPEGEQRMPTYWIAAC